MTQVLEKLTKVNNQRSECPFKIEAVEEKYKAKFVGMLPIKDRNGNWGTESVSVFWQQTPPVEGYSHYFALLTRGGTTYITSGASAVEGVITGMVAADGEIIYSSGRWDMRYSTDGSCWIDGGRDYTRMGENGQLIEMIIVDGDFYQLTNTVDTLPALP